MPLMQLRRKPALSRPLHGLQSLVQRGQTLFNLARDLTCAGQEGAIIGHPYFGPGGAVSRRTATQKQYPLCHLAILDLDPAARDGSHRPPKRETCSVATATSSHALFFRVTLSPTSESNMLPSVKLAAKEGG